MGESRSFKRPNPNLNTRSRHIKSMKKSRSSIVNARHDRHESGYTVDLADLLFTRDRHFLIRNNGQKVWVDELKGKTIVLYIVPINDRLCLKPGETLDMVQAYDQFLPLGGIEFVFVPVYLHCDRIEYSCSNYNHTRFVYSCCNHTVLFETREDYYNYLHSTMPWPAVPFSDVEACGDRVVTTFSVEDDNNSWWGFPYWVIIDPTSTVVAPRQRHPFLFKIFSGAELYPLSLQRINTLWDEYDFKCGDRCESRKRLIRNWDQLLASPTRDFLLSGNGDRVPISSLKGKLIGLYFCENVPRPPRMDVIAKAYQEAKLRGYDFEIVQINFHFHSFVGTRPNLYLCERQHYKNINWLTLPFKDPSCKKLQRIFECELEYDKRIYCLPFREGDCLVIVDSRLQASDGEVLFEFSGAEIIEQFGIEEYPFVRQTLFEREYLRQKKEVILQSYFPPGLCHFTRAVSDGGFEMVNASQLKGKRVIVLFSHYEYTEYYTFISMLKSRYLERAEEDKFEVVYVSIDDSKPECIDMPWLVYPYSPEFGKRCSTEVFKSRWQGASGVAAFDVDGQLIAKDYLYSRRMECNTHRIFPFFSHDLIEQISDEVKETYGLNWRY